MKNLLFVLFLFAANFVIAQTEPIVQPGSNPGSNRGGNVGNTTNRARNINTGGTQKKDSLQKRDKNADSLTISYRLMKDATRYKLDSSIADYIRFPTQPNYITLGNNGAPSKPILFTPIMQSGFVEGKHSLDAYKWTVDNLKFYKTTRPYTELAYVLGSKAEQNIQLTHTQNLKPDWNVAFDYRLISSPGYFRNQKNNHGNIVLNSYYQGKKKRYANWFAVLGNTMKASDYGGVLNDATLNDPTLSDRSLIETNLNNNVFTTRNPFDNKLESGQFLKERTFFLKQSYDFGKKDSIAINDSVTQYLFYPKLRLEHSFTYNTQSFMYRGLQNDSTYYKTNYAIDTVFTKSPTSFDLTDLWEKVSNDFSIYSFPDTKNTLQYIKAGIQFESWKGTFTEGTFRKRERDFTNLFLHGEYRNKTRNKKWDLNAFGNLYISGYNSGDYEANAQLIRDLGNKTGKLKLQFQNVNRTPSFIFYDESVFNFQPVANLKKENHTQITAQLFNEKKLQNITAQILLATNVTTWQNYKTYRQEDAFNLLKISFERTFKLYKKFVWHTEVHFQQALIGNPNINFATLYTRNRVAYEGNFGKKNLRIATGLEFRYIAPYNLDAWSPVTSQFIYQDTASSKNNLPDINAYLHFNITSFNCFIRAENLNTARIITGTANSNGLVFTNNNLAAVRYPNPGLLIRVGIYWRFVN